MHQWLGFCGSKYRANTYEHFYHPIGTNLNGILPPKVAVLEGQIGEHKSSWSGNQPGPLSEQQLLDCMENVSCGKHNGLGLALKYTARNGIASGRDYSYTASAGNCALLTNYGTEDITYPAVFGNIGYEYRTYIGLEDDLKKIVRAYGPVGILLPAKPLRDHESEGGVWEIESCRQYAVNHAAVIVGYGTKPKNHWIVVSICGPAEIFVFIEFFRAPTDNNAPLLQTF